LDFDNIEYFNTEARKKKDELGNPIDVIISHNQVKMTIKGDIDYTKTIN